MAEFIRVDPSDSKEVLRMLAEQALCAPVPEGWRGFYNPNYKCIFYFDKRAEVTTWHHPLERHFEVTAIRVKTISDEERRLQATGNKEAADAMHSRYEVVLARHRAWVAKVVQQETEDDREIRRLQFGKPFRDHLDQKLIDNRALPPGRNKSTGTSARIQAQARCWSGGQL
jgi:hypothetical protein